MVKGTVKAIGEREITVELNDDVKGVIQVKEFGEEGCPLKEGEEVEAKFTKFDKKKCVLNLSLKIKEQEEQGKLIKSYKASKLGAKESIWNFVKDKLRGAGPS